MRKAGLPSALNSIPASERKREAPQSRSTARSGARLRKGTAAYYNGSTFQVNIDGQARYCWPNAHGPTVEYDVGYEADCVVTQSVCAGTTDTLNRTYVTRLQSHRARDGVWITSDRGDLTTHGNGSGGGIAWCSQPFSFRDWLNFSGDTSLCS
jgi:hypothetical protein